MVVVFVLYVLPVFWSLRHLNNPGGGGWGEVMVVVFVLHMFFLCFGHSDILTILEQSVSH